MTEFLCLLSVTAAMQILHSARVAFVAFS